MLLVEMKTGLFDRREFFRPSGLGAGITGEEMAAGVPLQSPLSNNLNVTVPVGVGKPAEPVTIALSWMVCPTVM